MVEANAARRSPGGAMKVQTDVKAGGLLGLDVDIDIDIDIDLFGCNKGCHNSCRRRC
jgi:hypothetical protein